eukprot:TRINITY_DN14535_c0_g1_i1.p2 TRINITY_DN14535_c0_g1~~TRINITY_DN14535_c0_g1_i1.p2  ORF type:complete len:201 (+),score=44.34 TRINITY_DN14535_c0_g1_i1:34-603(+)
MKNVSSELNSVFPLMEEYDVQTIAAEMKDIVMLSSQYIAAARDSAARASYIRLKQQLQDILSTLVARVKESVEKATTTKKGQLVKTQLVSEIREAATDGIEAGRILQTEPISITDLRAVIRSMTQRTESAQEFVDDVTVKAKLASTCLNLTNNMEAFQRNPSSPSSRANMIAAIGAWLNVLQSLQAKLL